MQIRKGVFLPIFERVYVAGLVAELQNAPFRSQRVYMKEFIQKTRVLLIASRMEVSL